jgi:riboflavin kinase/FMN adenylyltransferase
MRIVRDTLFIAPEDRGAAAAIGNFDGVHLGHQAVIGIAEAEAVRRGVPLGVMTFEPHPRQFFAPDAPPFRLMNAAARAHRLEKLGVGVLYEVPFNAALAGLTAEEFARVVIAERLGLAHVVVGADFRFGKGRTGDAAALQDFGERFGFGVTIAGMVEIGEGLGDQIGDGEVSSTAIRRALSEGRPRDAAAMLGHWHRIEGPVIRGDQRGRDLGYPTANMSIAGLHPPRFGVYAVKVDVLEGPFAGTYDGAASIGVRPMFGVNLPNCETYIFDFKGDLYGTELSVALVSYLRPELKFDSLDALIVQMGTDCDRARVILADV